MAGANHGVAPSSQKLVKLDTNNLSVSAQEISGAAYSPEILTQISWHDLVCDPMQAADTSLEYCDYQ